MIRRLETRVRRARDHAGVRALILLYHRIGHPETDPWALAVTPHRLAEHLEVLRSEFEVVRLADLDRALHRKKRGRPLVVVTFDDGYGGAVAHAKPLLERAGIPATVFLPTAHIGSDREFWWDALDHALLQPIVPPEVITVTIRGQTHRWAIGDAALVNAAADQRHRTWRAWEDPPGPRQAVYRALYDLLLPLPERERRGIMDALLESAGHSTQGRPSYRCVQTAEVAALARGGVFEIGAHTVTHPVLAHLAPTEQWAEIIESKRRLEAMIGQPVDLFAYPYGRGEHYTQDTVALVRRAGFRCACANVPGAVDVATDRYQLPRLQVQDWDGETFRARLLA